MGFYATSNDVSGTSPQALTTSATRKTITALNAATASLRRARITDILMGAGANPNATDCPIIYEAIRTTSSGTSTAATPAPLDLANAASDTVGFINATAEPTLGAALMTIALNQRASQRWVAAPGSELYIPATNLSGIAVRASSTAYNGTAVVTLIHEDI